MSASDAMEQTIATFILREFLPGEAPENLTASTPLISSGILDSIARLRLVAFLEETYEITLAPGAGIGSRVPLWKPLFAELDVLWQHEMTFHEPDDRFSDVQVVRGRAALGIEVLPDLALFAGGGPLLSVSGSGSDQDWEPHFFGGVQVF